MYFLINKKKKKKENFIVPHLIENEIIAILFHRRWLVPIRWRLTLSLVCWRWFKKISSLFRDIRVDCSNHHYRTLLNHIDVQPMCIIKSQYINSIHFNDTDIILGDLITTINSPNDDDIDMTSNNSNNSNNINEILDDNGADNNIIIQQQQQQQQILQSKYSKHPLRYVHQRHAQQLRSIYFPQLTLVRMELVWSNSGLLAPLLLRDNIVFPRLEHFKLDLVCNPNTITNSMTKFDICKMLMHSPNLESIHLQLASFDVIPSQSLYQLINKQSTVLKKLSLVTNAHSNHVSHEIIWNVVNSFINRQAPLEYFNLSVCQTNSDNIPQLFKLLGSLVTLDHLILYIYDRGSSFTSTQHYNDELCRLLIQREQSNRPLKRLESLADVEENMLNTLKTLTISRLSFGCSRSLISPTTVRLNLAFRPQLTRLDLLKLPTQELLIYDLINSNPHLASLTIRNCGTLTCSTSQLLMRHLARSDLQLVYFKLSHVPYLSLSLVDLHRSLKTNRSLQQIKLHLFCTHSITYKMQTDLLTPSISRFQSKRFSRPIDILITTSSDYHETYTLFKSSTFKIN